MSSETCNRVRVERYFLAEASSEEKRATGVHLESCGRCKDHLDFLSRERQAYLAVRPFTAFAARHLEGKAPSRAFAFGPRWIPALAGAAACLALVVVLRNPDGRLQGGSAESAAISETRRTGGAETRYKGGDLLEYHVDREGRLEPGNPSAEHRSGDRLQFVHASEKAAYASLLSLDAAGKVSVYRAEGAASASVPVEAGKVAPFPFSVTLDESRGGELFVAVFSETPGKDKTLEDWLAELYAKAEGDLARVQGLLSGKVAAPAPVTSVKTLLLRKAAT